MEIDHSIETHPTIVDNSTMIHITDLERSFENRPAKMDSRQRRERERFNLKRSISTTIECQDEMLTDEQSCKGSKNIPTPSKRARSIHASRENGQFKEKMNVADKREVNQSHTTTEIISMDGGKDRVGDESRKHSSDCRTCEGVLNLLCDNELLNELCVLLANTFVLMEHSHKDLECLIFTLKEHDSETFGGLANEESDKIGHVETSSLAHLFLCKIFYYQMPIINQLIYSKLNQ